MRKLLLHVCCAPCAAYPISALLDKFSLTLLFYGPNIHPLDEYERRMEAARKISHILKVNLVELEYAPDRWIELTKGLENEPEGGKRCFLCYKIRLEKTALFAKENGFELFGCTLTLSPHKPANVINPIGREIAKNYGLSFLEEDFKKKDGFKKSCQMSRGYDLYRQNYCGCKYSNHIEPRRLYMV